jgi:hypothetical protein
MNHHSLSPGSSPAMGERPEVTEIESDASSDSEKKSAGGAMNLLLATTFY